MNSNVVPCVRFWRIKVTFPDSQFETSSTTTLDVRPGRNFLSLVLFRRDQNSLSSRVLKHIVLFPSKAFYLITLLLTIHIQETATRVMNSQLSRHTHTHLPTEDVRPTTTRTITHYHVLIKATINHVLERPQVNLLSTSLPVTCRKTVPFPISSVKRYKPRHSTPLPYEKFIDYQKRPPPP